MSNQLDSYEKGAREILAQVGKTINIGVPLGLGKPIGLLNALFRLACDDSSIKLTIITGLTLARPRLKNELEKRFIEPILDRLLGDCEDPLYEKYRESQTLPENINVIEFFLSPGKFIHNGYVQQNYVSSSYTSVARDVADLSVNVLAQQVSPSPTNPRLYSLSCNTDLFHELERWLKKSAEKGNKIAMVAEVNGNLPFMYGLAAEVEEKVFTQVIDTKRYRSLFALPRDELSTQDHLIGLYTSALIKDNGCLQIGIGKLSNALAAALIFRQRGNKLYRELLQELQVREKFGTLVSDLGSDGLFDKGLYASTEMFSDEYIQLYKAGILKKRVYEHIGLQRLLNANLIGEKITPDMIDILIGREIIHSRLTALDVEFLKTFGIFKPEIQFQNESLILPSGETLAADLSSAVSKQAILKSCLGDRLKSGKVIHAGFFFGSVDLYSSLNQLAPEERQLFEMTSVARTNSLILAPQLLRLQRQEARLVNSSLMLTLAGDVISDVIKDYQEISGVGGQHDFVSMASQLRDGRSLINCRSTRINKGKVESNIVWDYPNSTIPRYLRDLVVTEYGIADCRGKTDSQVIKAILNIADSRFQERLLLKAKKAGKISPDYQIPKVFKNNYPEAIEKVLEKVRQQGYCQPYPFGSDLSQEEQTLSRALLNLKNASRLQLVAMSIASVFFFKSDRGFDGFLRRMKLKPVKNFRDYFYKKLLKYVLRRYVFA